MNTYNVTLEGGSVVNVLGDSLRVDKAGRLHIVQVDSDAHVFAEGAWRACTKAESLWNPPPVRRPRPSK